MSLLDSELQDGLRDMEDLQAGPDTGRAPLFTWAGSEWPSTRNTLKSGSSYESGGKSIFYDFALRVRLDALDTTAARLFSDVTAPVSGDTLTIDSIRYRVEFVDRAHGAFLTLLLTFDGK